MLIFSDSRSISCAAAAVLMATLLATPSRAETAPDLAQIDKMCAELGASAALVLDLRASGMPLSRVLEVSKLGSPAMDRFARDMAMAAYSLPNFTSPTMRTRQKQEFRNEIELTCHTALREE